MAPSQIRQFLLIMDVRKASPRSATLELTTRRPSAYEAAEAEHRGDSNYDIVLVGSDSLETVKLTHGSYFAASEEDLREAVRREITGLGAG